MEFVHTSYEKGRTIAAIATPSGEGGISIIRISGDDALLVANKVFSKDLSVVPSHTAHFGKIYNQKKEVLDQALALVMIAPNSFTGENTVELQCHGGSLITQAVLNAVYLAGAEPALPGEFSYKAFKSGKIDLTQAEAIQELISAKNETALKNAKRHLDGDLQEAILSLQKELVEVASIFEAWVDYPEEGLEFASLEEICDILKKLDSRMEILLSSYKEGKILKEGLRLCLIGAPNAGKSSLMNALSRKQRAIVTEIAGTTRDVIEEEIFLQNHNIILSDTAGIRETEECIEKEGIKRSYLVANDADLILYVIDSTKTSFAEEKKLLLQFSNEKLLLVFNKCDITSPSLEEFENFSKVCVSAKNKTGLDELKEAILSLAMKKSRNEETSSVLVTSERHFKALNQAKLYVNAALSGLTNDLSPELLCIDIKAALKELGTIIGFNITEDILSSIFSKFCVGK